jgi:hypothetical protein
MDLSHGSSVSLTEDRTSVEYLSKVWNFVRVHIKAAANWTPFLCAGLHFSFMTISLSSKNIIFF